MTTPDPADLAALGLPPHATQVLALLGEEGWTTSVALAARTGTSRSVVSQAVETLVELGLVTRTRGRRPAPLRLHPDADLVLVERLQQLADARRLDAERADRAAAWIRAVVTRCRAQPAPVHLLDPAGAPPGYRLATCHKTHDEVARANGSSVLFGASVSRRQVRRRLLVLGDPPEERTRTLLHWGVELRTTSALLPVLLVIDDERARVEVSADGRASRTGWTHDPAQVAALSRLFQLWWQEAEPVQL